MKESKSPAPRLMRSTNVSASIDWAQSIVQRIQSSFMTLPSAEDWLFTFTIAAVLAIPFLVIGHYSNIFSFDHIQFSIPVALKIIPAPCIAEELVWRVMCNPHKGEYPRLQKVIICSILSNFCYVISHPLNAWYLRPVAREVFCHPGFLVIITLLGFAGNLVFYETRSLWPPVLLHWLTVFVWLSLGGRHKAPLI